MGVPELPFEILINIADNLWKTDIMSCALIYNCSQLPKLIDSIKNSQNISTSHHLMVQSLCLSMHCHWSKIPNIQYSDLFRYLPNLKRLDLEGIKYDDIQADITVSDKIWKSLEILNMTYGGSDEIQPERDLMVEDFDDIHQNLQNLSSITAEIYIYSEFPDALDTVPNTIPAYSVTSLDINSKIYDDGHEEGEEKDYESENININHWNSWWLYYFGYKYPNLRSLKLNVTDMLDDALYPEERKIVLSLFHSNQNAFRHLETFDLKTTRYFDFSDLILWELLCKLRVPLKHLSLDTTYRGKIDYSYPMDVGRILESFSGTLKSLSLTGFTYNQKNEYTIQEMSSCCPFLTNLYISDSSFCLNLDDLLDKCSALEQMEFSGAKLFLSQSRIAEESEQQQQQQHGLRILTLNKCSVAAGVFNYVSLRCRSLEQMTLYTLRIIGSICEKTGCLLFDMSHIFLKTLNIGQVQYGTSYEEIRDDNNIGLTLLSWLKDIPLSDKKNEKEKKMMWIQSLL